MSEVSKTNVSKTGLSKKGEMAPVLRYSCILLAIVVLNQIFRFTPNLPQILYYAAIILLNGILFFGGLQKGAKIGSGMWFFWAVMWISIFWNYNEIPFYFLAPYRTIGFFLALLVAAPWVSDRLLNSERMLIFDTMNKGMIFMAVLSGMGRIFHFLPTDDQGFYLGCSYHSMDLAAVAGIACLSCLYNYQRLKKPVWYAAFACSLLVILFASSRTVLASCTMGILGFYHTTTSGKLGNTLKGVMCIVILLFIASFLVPESFRGMLNKSLNGSQDGSITTTSFIASRHGIWDDRLHEIEDFPVFGTGAHTIRYGSAGINGQIEPGNAWLYVFSSMGVLAFLSFTGMILIGLRRSVFYGRYDPKARLVFSLLVFFCFYMVGEAHVTAMGEFTCFYFWLLLALALFYEFEEPGGNFKGLETGLENHV